jgi:uroporphyrinogen decarboxylase
MNSRERQLAAIRHETPDRIPVDVITIETRPEIAGLLGIAEEDVYDTLGIDGRILPSPYIGPLPAAIGPFKLTQWGTADGGPYGQTAANPYPLADATTIAEIERYPWPDAALYDYETAAQTAVEWSRRYAIRGPGWMPVFWRACELFGMEEAMWKMKMQPAVFEAAVEHLFEHIYDRCRRLVEACGAHLDILMIEDDFASQQGLLISPGDWRRFLKPRYARLFEIGKRAGKFVWFHSCGNITSVLPDLIDIGMDVWETVQLHTLPVSPAQLKREYGRSLTFFGGINTQRLPFISPVEVRAEVQQVIEILGAGGGYICGPDHHIKPDVPAENTVALFHTALAFRQPGHTR